MHETTRVAPFLTPIWNAPSESVLTPLEVPFSMTAAPGTGRPPWSTTFPFIGSVCWAYETRPPANSANNARMQEMNSFLDKDISY